MFTRSEKPRVFAVPLGVDFGQSLINGLRQRCTHMKPHEFAAVEILVNTRRTGRRITELFQQGQAGFLPKIRLLTDLESDPSTSGVPFPVAPLRRRFELSQLVAQLVHSEPDLAPSGAIFDLSDSLASLMDEMKGEGVSPNDIRALDVSDKSGHWQRALRFFDLVQTYLEMSESEPDVETRRRLVVERKIADWDANPPEHPIIVAGSTGSRGTTALLMDAVAKLPQGAIILPGFDFDLGPSQWADLNDFQDHAQFRFKSFMDRLQLESTHIQRWSADLPANTLRNQLVSLALRPAPVTDQWLSDGPNLGDLGPAMADVTLIEAASPKEEADVIALRLRLAIEEGQTAALISPDRMLTRQVAAALDRWQIKPDDSAGQPLSLSPPGRFLRHVADLLRQKPDTLRLLTLLKHPICHSGHDRNLHLLRTHDLELELRRNGPPHPNRASLTQWAKRTAGPDVGRMAWANWLGNCLDLTADHGDRHLTHHVETHFTLVDMFSAGVALDGTGELWREAAGRKAQKVCDQIKLHADAGGMMSSAEYVSLFQGVLSKEEVRDRDSGHPNILIWGTLEARVQAADLVILGSLNDGTWPSAPSPDPWLNRQMRAEAGMLLPDRQIGLSAHDFQQAIATKNVWLTRSMRSSDADTIPSRWLNRISNLLDGLPDQNGPAVLGSMRERGHHYLAQTRAISTPKSRLAPAARPSPSPPVSARPKQMSVTQIKTLIRDPFSIYARKVLRLSPLDPILHQADAPMRGTITHTILEKFIKNGLTDEQPLSKQSLLDLAAEVLNAECPWPATRQLWLSRIERVADWFLEAEVQRQVYARPVAFEARGELSLNRLDFQLTGYADRIDQTHDGQAILYDYKTGAPPSASEQRYFDKQLLLEAAMVERGGFPSIEMTRVADAAFIGLGGVPKVVNAPLDDTSPDQVWEEFHDLIRAWGRPDRGYTARLAHMKEADTGPYDHLSRYGEWDMSMDPTSEDLE